MPPKKKHNKCPDCNYCQACSKTRCRLCRSGKEVKPHSGITGCFTYEEYQRWKLKKGHVKSAR